MVVSRLPPTSSVIFEETAALVLFQIEEENLPLADNLFGCGRREVHPLARGVVHHLLGSSISMLKKSSALDTACRLA